MVNNLKFVLVGLPQSGKTTILSMLPYFNHAERAGGLCERLGVRVTVRPANRATIDYVAENRTSLMTTGAFPAATDAVRQLALDVNLRWPDRSETVSIEVPDIPGELWQQRLSPDDPAARHLADALAHCDGILLLVDPAGIASTPPGGPASDPVVVFQENCEMLYVALRERMRAAHQIAARDATLPIPVALVLTKAERYWVDPTSCRIVRRLMLKDGRPVPYESGGDCWEFPMESEATPVDPDQAGAIEHVICAQGLAAERLVQVMKFFFHEVSYYAVSAVGMVSRGGRWVPNIVSARGASAAAETRVADPAHLRPVGLVEPLVGLVAAVRRELAVEPGRKEAQPLPPPVPAPSPSPARPPVPPPPRVPGVPALPALVGQPSPAHMPHTPAPSLVSVGEGMRVTTPAYGNSITASRTSPAVALDEDFFQDVPTDPSLVVGAPWDDLTPLAHPEERALDLRRKASVVAALALSFCAVVFLFLLVRR